MSNPTSYSWVTNEDIVSPTISSIVVVDAFTLRVIYSEAVVSQEAVNPTNYSFNGGLTVQSITEETAASYLVKTSQQTPAFSYTLTVNNVHDLFGNVT